MLIRNTLAAHRTPLSDADHAMLGVAGAEQAMGFLARRDGHAPTPLIRLPSLAGELEVASILVKDESQRLGLGSFKALGGAYAVVRLATERAAERLGRSIDVADWRSAAVAEAAAGMTFACATDGNHGRSVAQGARLIGASCVVFVHAGVSEARAQSIARHGARIARVAGHYDDAVAEASRQAAGHGWTLVSDTSWHGYERIPYLVMQGYTAMLHEAVGALSQPPTHVFVQAGVGGLAAAVAAYFVDAYGQSRPLMTVVEPSNAACVFESARAGGPMRVAHERSTVMAMLECHEPSIVAWRILERAADAFMTVDDAQAIAAMNRLARPVGTDAPVVAGESGGVGIAGLAAAVADKRMRDAIGLNAASRVFLINTEGATDPALYETLVGASPENVLERRADEPVKDATWR